MDSTIFEYGMYGAWFEEILSIKVYNLYKDNVICELNLIDLFDQQPSHRKYSLHQDVIDEIMSIMKNDDELFQIEEVEYPIVFDGVTNRFVFTRHDTRKEILAFNIWFYQTRESVQAKIVIETFHKIQTILKNAGIPTVFMELNTHGNSL